MSVSSLPEWKQLLLERKRREEEERGRREKQEEEKLANMPAWKRGIIQRRKAKQDSLVEREKDKDVCLIPVDVRAPSDGLSDTDSFVTVSLGSELSLSPDPGQWLDAEVKAVSQVSLETIVPVHENPFIRTQTSWRKGRDVDGGTEQEVKEREKDKSTPRSQDGEPGRGRDIELKIERFRDLSEGREKEKDRGRDRSQGRERENSREWKDSVKDTVREREFLKVRQDEEEKEADPPASSLSPLVPCLRTIRADNIFIIEQDRKSSDERRGRWRETERERPEEEHHQQRKRGVKMDLREILAGGGSVTEIRASEVLIIKPSTSSAEERSPTGGGKGLGREDAEMKGSMDGRPESVGRELRTDMSWLRDKEKERPWGQATVIKEERKDSLDDNVFVDRGGRVSQLLSKFGQHPKLPSRSTSSDNFLRPGRRKFSGDDDESSESEGRNILAKGVPKRSFSFSDRVVSAKENGLEDSGCYERKMRERTHSEKSVVPWIDVAGTAKFKQGCARLLDKDRFVKQKERSNEAEIHKGDFKRVEPMDVRALEKAVDAEGDEGFTVASVKNTEGISFARRIPIRQEGKTRAEREMKNIEKDPESQVSELWKEEGFEGPVPSEAVPKSLAGAAASVEVNTAGLTAESLQRHESAFTECSSLPCPIMDSSSPQRGPERSGLQETYPTHSVLSQHTEDLISKIEKIGDTTVYGSAAAAKESKQDASMYGDSASDALVHDVPPRSPKRITPMGIPPGPLDIQIPRTVFYVAEDMLESAKVEGQSDKVQEGRGVERRDSWRIGKPLSRIESLREKIRQRELEKLKQNEAQEGVGGSEGVEVEVEVEVVDQRGAEAESDAAAQMRKRLLEAERRQEEAVVQTSTAPFDVTQEVSMLKTCPQLPVSVQQVDRGEKATSDFAAAAFDVLSDGFQTSEDEDDLVKHVEEQLRHHRSQQEEEEEEEDEEEEEEEKEVSDEELEEYTSPPEPGQSLSPLPPHPNSLAAMSRIYNLETVGSRSGLYVRERKVDIPSVHLVKVKPLVSNKQKSDVKPLPDEDVCGVQTIQRQIEQFELKEQEVLKSCSSPNSPLKERVTKVQQSPRGLLKHQARDDAKTQEKDQETPSPKATPQQTRSPTSALKQSNQTITVTPSLLRSQSPDNTLKPADCAPTPASSPSSPSPSQSPSISPSPSPSPTLFSIRSASGGKVKRGTTITISPRKPPIGGGGAGGATASTVVSPVVGSSPAKPSPQQTQVASASAEPVKKKYPTVEEIEVIGGYQNLEKSCLIKNRGTPKRGKVCFDEEQLEQVCEYPSETSMLACTPYPHDLWRLQGEEADGEEAEVEGGTIVSKSTKNVGIAVGRGLRVDESCPR